MIGLFVPVKVWPPGDTVTLYEVMGLPPFEAGAVKEMIACAFPALTETPVGDDGGAAGVTVAEDADGGLVPAAFVAVTVNEYAVPFVRPLTVIGLVAPSAVCGVAGPLAGVAVTV